jgi:hypothetical protein
MISDSEQEWPALPTETEIYILPNGEIVVADLPAELAAQLSMLSPTSFQGVGDEESSSPASTESTYVAH